jgi:hypothetical protein
MAKCDIIFICTVHTFYRHEHHPAQLNSNFFDIGCMVVARADRHGEGLLDARQIAALRGKICNDRSDDQIILIGMNSL